MVRLAPLSVHLSFPVNEVDPAGLCVFCEAFGCRSRSRETVLHVLCHCPLYSQLRHSFRKYLRLELLRAYPQILPPGDIREVMQQIFWVPDATPVQGDEDPAKLASLPVSSSSCDLLFHDWDVLSRDGWENFSVGRFMFEVFRWLWTHGQRERAMQILLVGDEHPLLDCWVAKAWALSESRRRASFRACGARFKARKRPVQAVVHHCLAKYFLSPALALREERLGRWCDKRRNDEGKLQSLTLDNISGPQKMWARRFLFPYHRRRDRRLRS